jgi:putative endonuclease
MFCCNILYSPSLDKYYIGETENIEERLNYHNSGFFKSSYTHKVNDWIIFINIPSRNRIHTRKIEKFLKHMKNRSFIMKLKENPKIIEDIVKRFL